MEVSTSQNSELSALRLSLIDLLKDIGDQDNYDALDTVITQATLFKEKLIGDKCSESSLEKIINELITINQNRSKNKSIDRQKLAMEKLLEECKTHQLNYITGYLVHAFSQNTDYRNGDLFKGHCYGYSQLYSKFKLTPEIISPDAFFAQLHLNNNVYHAYQNQHNRELDQATIHKTRLTRPFVVTDKTQYGTIISNFLQQYQSNELELGLRDQHTNNGHSVRLNLNHNQTVEFFDPSYGYFKIPNINEFILFFNNWMELYVKTRNAHFNHIDLFALKLKNDEGATSSFNCSELLHACWVGSKYDNECSTSIVWYYWNLACATLSNDNQKKAQHTETEQPLLTETSASFFSIKSLQEQAPQLQASELPPKLNMMT